MSKSDILVDVLDGDISAAKEKLEELSRDELIALRDACITLAGWCMDEFRSAERPTNEGDYYIDLPMEESSADVGG